MLDIKYIAENKDRVKQKLLERNGVFDIDGAVLLYEKKRAIISEVENLKAQRNTATKQIELLKKNKQNADAQINQMRKNNERIKVLDKELLEVSENLDEILLNIPNIPDDSVPVGKDDSANVQVRVFGDIPKLDFEPKAHWEIGVDLDILDFDRAAKISGTRFTINKSKGAKLERAIINLMLDTHGENGYKEIFTPFLVNKDSMCGTGQLPKFEEDMFSTAGGKYYLIPTAEVSVTNMHRDEIISSDSLPICYCAYSACFRAEAGSAGRDTRGIIRQHQFNKVELVKFCKPENSFDELEKLTADAEKILKLLELPYRVVALSSGDLGFSSAKTYDIEVYMPSYNRYVEISSCSNFLSFQARRANIRYRDADGKTQLVHTLNGSGLAAGRTLAAVLENYQNADGSVTVPKALRKYTGFDTIEKQI